MEKEKKHDIQIISYLARKLGVSLKELKDLSNSDYGMFSKAKTILYLANRRAITLSAFKLINEDFYVLGTKLYLDVFDNLDKLDNEEDLISESEKKEIDFVIDAYYDNNALYFSLNNNSELSKFYITPENILRTRNDWTKEEKLNWLMDKAAFELEDIELEKLIKK